MVPRSEGMAEANSSSHVKYAVIRRPAIIMGSHRAKDAK